MNSKIISESFLSFTFTYMILEIIINYSKKFHCFSVSCVYSLYYQYYSKIYYKNEYPNYNFFTMQL